MGHPEPKTIKEPKVTVTVQVEYTEPVKFTDTVDLGEVPANGYTPPPNEVDPTGLINIDSTSLQGAIEQIDPLLGGGGSTVEGVVSWRNAINETLTATPQQISNLVFTIGNAESAIPPGNYRVKAIIKCLMASGKNENITINFQKRNILDITPAWVSIPEEVTFNQAYLTTTSENYGVSNRPNYVVLEEVLPLLEGEQVGVFINSETSGGATVENSQLFYEKTAMTINRYAGNFDV